MSDFQDVLYETRNGVAWITINRPERYNAFRMQTIDDLIGADEDAYVEAAVALAQNPERRARLRTGLRPLLLASPLLDAPAYARTVETAYRRMWMNWAG